MNGVYVFIDSQNLNLAIKDCGWKLDFKRFYYFLKHKYRSDKIFLFIGYIPENAGLYKKLDEMGYVLIFKPVLKNRSGVVKGNVDAELVLHTMIEFNSFNRAIIISGDGDFFCLVEYLNKNNKLFKIGIPNKARFSSLLKKFKGRFFFISDLRHKLI